MSNFGSTDWLIEVAKGNIPGHSLIQKFGHNEAVGTTLAPIALGGIYRTPQVGGATALRIKAGNVNDDAAGTGAQEVTLQGLDETGTLITVPLATAGAVASAPTVDTFIRFFRAWVSGSGTYATQLVGSHAGDIVIENAAGTEDWGTIDAMSLFPRSQTEIGVYSIPIGFTGFVLRVAVFSDSSKITSALFFRRRQILQTVPPYEAMRLVFDSTLEGGDVTIDPRSALNHFDGPCDMGVMAAIDVGTASVHTDFEILVVDNNFLPVPIT